MARHLWEAYARTPGYARSVALPIASVSGVIRHLGVDACTLNTTFTADAWEALGRNCGLLVYRDRQQIFSGLLTKRRDVWDRSTGRDSIHVEAVGDDQLLADRDAFPDPLRAADDQTVNDYWAYTGIASTAMQRLISDQAGPTCASVRKIPGLVLGADPGVGISRTWTGLFDGAGPKGVLDLLAVMSVASGQNLGVRFTAATGSLTVDIIKPRDLTESVRFSADLGNLVGYTYEESAPTVTDAVAAGQGDLHARLRKWVTTSSSEALSWGRRIWQYVDRRDTADLTELTKAAQDAVDQGDATVNLQVSLIDSDSARFGDDYGLGDTVTVSVGRPGQAKTDVQDVIREIAFTVDSKGVESITPAIGTYDAKAIIPTPTQQAIAAVGARLAAVSRK